VHGQASEVLIGPVLAKLVGPQRDQTLGAQTIRLDLDALDMPRVLFLI